MDKGRAAQVRAEGLVSAGTQIYYANFNEVFLKLPPAIHARAQEGIDRIGLHLAMFRHYSVT